MNSVHQNCSPLLVASLIILCPLAIAAALKIRQSNEEADSHSSHNGILFRIRNCRPTTNRDADERQITNGGYESLIGNTPLVYLPHLSSLLHNNVRIYAKLENNNPGGTGKDRAARSMILAAEQKGQLPPPLMDWGSSTRTSCSYQNQDQIDFHDDESNHKNKTSTPNNSNIPSNIQTAIQTALINTKTHGIIIEGTSGSTGISLASISSSRGHGVIVVMPDDQSSQKREFLERLGCGVVVVQNCSISNPGHYVNVARRIWEWVEVERRFDTWYGEQSKALDNIKGGRVIKAAFMNQFENLSNLHSQYMSTGPEIYNKLHGKVDAFVMSAGTGGTIVGVGGYLKDKWWSDCGKLSIKQPRACPRIILVDPPGSSLYNKVKFGVAYTSQMSEQRLRRHRYDTLAEGIGLDRITANFGLGCTDIVWSEDGSSFKKRLDEALDGNNSICTSRAEQSTNQSKVIDDAISITDQQAVFMAHYLLRHEGLFVGSSSAMNIAGAILVASTMPPNSNVVTVICDGGQRHTSRFWNREFIEQWGLDWPESASGDIDQGVNLLEMLGIHGIARPSASLA